MRFEVILAILYAIIRDVMSRNLLLIVLFLLTNIAIAYQYWQLQDHVDNLSDSICYNIQAFNQPE